MAENKDVPLYQKIIALIVVLVVVAPFIIALWKWAL